MSLQVGQILNNRYRMVGLLGQGGFGAVYRAWDLNLKKPCAVKENFDTTPESARQFEQEALILANLSHPNLPRVTDHFVLPAQGQYLVMDFVEGEDLQTKIKQSGKLPEHEVLPWIEQVCDALTYLHTQTPPIIHRDIKPANIRITPDGRAMLVDFGIAKRYETQGKTTVGARAITPGFSPPEQYGKGGTDARSDVYALGATLYAALTGQEPVESVQRTTGNPLPPPHQFNPTVSAPLETALLTAMALMPDARYQTATTFKRALHPATTLGITGSLTTNFGSTITTTTPTPQKFPVAWAAGSVVVLGLFLAGIVWILTGNPPPTRTPTLPVSGVSTVTDTPVPPPSATLNIQGTQQAEAGRQTEEANLAARETALAAGFLTQTAAVPPPPEPTTLPTPETGPRVSPVDGMTMVFVPAGEFLMGSTEQDLADMLVLCPGCSLDSISDQDPQRSIYLDAYWFDRTEVTNAQFAQFVAETGYETQAEREGGAVIRNPSSGRYVYTSGADWQHPDGPSSTLTGRDAHPVRQVSWDDAKAYCQWAGRRLPTEAEWEKAARGTDGRFFPWGNTAPTNQMLNFNLNVQTTTEAGSYPAWVSPYGALDMAGNVWEWVADFYQHDYYIEMPNTNPLGPLSAEMHTLRGGSWASESGAELVYVMSTFRFANYNYFRSALLGFRCAMYAEETTPAASVQATPTPAPRVYEFFACPAKCEPNGANATLTFPEPRSFICTGGTRTCPPARTTSANGRPTANSGCATTAPGMARPPTWTTSP